MARPRLISPTVDLMKDEGAVLFSLVKGEQREFPVELDFVSDSTLGYVFEAVVVEAANTASQKEPPTSLMSNGAQTTLTVRLPVFMGDYTIGTEYSLEEVVLFGGNYYKLMTELLTADEVTPDINENWVLTSMNIVYLQFNKELSDDWAQSPIINVPMYGFFELRVTEPANNIITQTWKPVRGLIEILFSPTDIVADQ